LDSILPNFVLEPKNLRDSQKSCELAKGKLFAPSTKAEFEEMENIMSKSGRNWQQDQIWIGFEIANLASKRIQGYF